MPGATAPIQGTNVQTNSDFGSNNDQDIGQTSIALFQKLDPDFAPRIPPLINDFVPPMSIEQIPNVPQATVHAGHQPPPHHVESTAHASSSARTTYSSRPGCDHVVGSSHNTPPRTDSFPSVNNKGPIANSDMPKLALANSPINVTNLAIKLRDYPLRQQARELEDGFKFGFRLGFIGERIEQKSKNLTSALELKTETMAKINKEIQKGRVAGPFETVPLSNFRSSPIGLVPKKLPGDFRLIHHLSWPKGTSVNDQIDPSMCSVKYSSFDEAVTIVQNLAPTVTWLNAM